MRNTFSSSSSSSTAAVPRNRYTRGVTNEGVVVRCVCCCEHKITVRLLESGVFFPFRCHGLSRLSFVPERRRGQACALAELAANRVNQRKHASMLQVKAVSPLLLCARTEERLVAAAWLRGTLASCSPESCDRKNNAHSQHNEKYVASI